MSRNENNSIGNYLFSIVKAFVFFAFGGSVLFGIFYSILIRSFNGFFGGLMFGVTLAIIAVPIVVLVDIFYKIKCYLKYKIIPFSIKQEIRFLIAYDYISAFNRALSILKDNNFKVKNADIGKGAIEAITDSSKKSPGEDVIVRLFRYPEGKGTLIVLTSKPGNPLTLIDCGKNLENIEIILNDFKSGLQDEI